MFTDVSMEVICTLAIIMHVCNFEKEAIKYKLILRKAKEFINAQSSIPFDKLEERWNSTVKCDKRK